LVFFAACGLVLADDEVVLAGRGFVVTTEDFDRYLTEQDITGARRDRTLAKEGAVQAVFENLYMVRAFAIKGEKNPAIDQTEIDWKVTDFRERLLMKEQLKFEVEAAVRDTDWDALAKEKYTANKPDYMSDEQVSAAHILIGLTDRTSDEAKARADEVVARLQAGEDFEALAQQYSDDQNNAGKGGELGFFSQEGMVKPFADTAFALTEEGEISAPVETQYGYHIIRFNERRPQTQLSLEEVKARIVPSLKTSVRRTVYDDKIAAMRSGDLDVGLEVNRSLLNEYVLRYRGNAETDTKK